jgi:hypothetical protein
MPSEIQVLAGTAQLEPFPGNRCQPQNCGGQKEYDYPGNGKEFSDEDRTDSGDGKRERNTPEDSFDEGALPETVEIGKPCS